MLRPSEELTPKAKEALAADELPKSPTVAPIPPPFLGDAIILRADRRRAADAMTDLGRFGSKRDARAVLLALEPLEDTRASMAREAEAAATDEERWRLRGCLLRAGAAPPDMIERWYLEAAAIAQEATDGDTEPMGASDG